MRRIGLGLISLMVLGGCKAAHVDATVVNHTGGVVSLVEVDYPSTSFGTESLAAGAVYHYRFKILGSGDTKVIWTDAAKKEHTVKGPELLEGEDGLLSVTLSGETAVWSKDLKR